jgi:hypothetical protein
MRTKLRFAAQIVLLTGFTLPLTITAQQLQRTLASTTAKFESVSKSDTAWQKALESHELDAAKKLIGHPGSFRGTVSKVYESRDGDIVILDFDSNYRTALTAVLKKPDFSKFPDLRALEGKDIIVSGMFVDYQGKAEIALTMPDQIRLAR